MIEVVRVGPITSQNCAANKYPSTRTRPWNCASSAFDMASRDYRTCHSCPRQCAGSVLGPFSSSPVAAVGHAFGAGRGTFSCLLHRRQRSLWFGRFHTPFVAARKRRFFLDLFIRLFSWISVTLKGFVEEIVEHNILFEKWLKRRHLRVRQLVLLIVARVAPRRVQHFVWNAQDIGEQDEWLEKVLGQDDQIELSVQFFNA